MYTVYINKYLYPACNTHEVDAPHKKWLKAENELATTGHEWQGKALAPQMQRVLTDAIE